MLLTQTKFPNPNDVEFHEALEKALKSLKTRKWRYNKKRWQALLHEENEKFSPNQRRRINVDSEEDLQTIIRCKDTQEEIEDSSELEETTEETEKAEIDNIQNTDAEYGAENNNIDLYSDTQNMDDTEGDDQILAQDKNLLLQGNLMENEEYYQIYNDGQDW